MKLFNVAGTDVRLHPTFLLLVAWIGVVQWIQGGANAAVYGIVFITLLFVCVVLHEFGHIFAARRYGIRTPDVTLLPIGGVASLERMPEKPSQEIVVALQAGQGIAPVLDVMTREIATVGETACLETVFTNLLRNTARFVGVVDRDQKLIGYLTPENISELVLIKSSRSAQSQQARA